MPHVRPMTESDIEAAYRVASFAFSEDDSEVLNRTPEEIRTRKSRYRLFLEHDPEGCFVAEEDGRVVGVAIAIIREGLWVLSLLVVDREHRASGVGRQLIGAALSYGGDSPEGMIASSTHPAAMRTYANAGFTLHPTFTAKGKVRSENIPSSLNVRDGSSDDLDFAADVSRYLRGASHGPDVEFMLGRSKMLVADGERGRGYAIYEGNNLWIMGATSDEVASELMWGYLGGCDPLESVEVRWITAQQSWAVEVVLAAGLDLHPDGPICVKGNPGPLTPYLPSGPYL